MLTGAMICKYTDDLYRSFLCICSYVVWSTEPGRHRDIDRREVQIAPSMASVVLPCWKWICLPSLDLLREGGSGESDRPSDLELVANGSRSDPHKLDTRLCHIRLRLA